MPFKSDKQRRAMFAMLNKGDLVKTSSGIVGTYQGIKPKGFEIKTMIKNKGISVFTKTKPDKITKKQLSFNQTRSLGIPLNANSDADKDGIKNSKDCKPFDPKKQGLLHEFQMKILRKREELAEKKREKQLAKLEDLKDELRIKQSIAGKKAETKREELRQKQSVIDEIDREKSKLRQLQAQNRKAQEQLDDLTVTGSIKKGVKVFGGRVADQAKKDSLAVLSATKKFVKDPKTRKVAHDITTSARDLVFGKPKRTRSSTSRVSRKKSRKKRSNNLGLFGGSSI